ncbi:hypothetical protein [Paracoccus zeaxanthinifaciens]|uniref:hypothetical protein n=1 Tax=Paracoccus zeaxanthinifaciens TaxID=187400 RepID=UPI0003B5F413|nr:hypothetical protein [Paracoccus zeaxanthinifaciens]
MAEFKEVSRNDFYRAIGPLDVVFDAKHFDNGRMCETTFKFRDGRLKGRSIGKSGCPDSKKFYLAEKTS